MNHSTVGAATPAGISRRRVLGGIAWATPAIMVATAAPSFAAGSTREPGGLVISGTGIQDASVFTVTATTIFNGGATPATAYPVSGITTAISVPTARVAAGAGATAVTGWSYVSRAVSGADTVFTFAWSGADLADGATIPSLVATLPKSSDRTAVSLAAQSFGTSNGTPVQSNGDTVSIAAFSLLAFNSGPAGYHDTSGSPRYTHIQFAVLNSPASNTANVVGVRAHVTVATANTGTGTPSVAGFLAGTWSYVNATTSGANTTYHFALTAGTMAPSYSPVQAEFNIPRPQSANNTTIPYTIVIDGTSPNAQGAVTTLTGTASI